MRKLFTPGRLLLAGAILAVITFGVLWLAPSDDYLLLPDEAHPVAPLVTVETPKRGGGRDGVYFVDLIQKQASLLESIFPSIRNGSTLVPQSRVNPHGIAESVRRQADLGQMARSQEIAAAVALRELGYDVQIRENGAFVASVYSDLPAFGKILPGEVIIAVNGRPVRSTLDLQELIAANKPGTPLTLTLRHSEGRPTLTTPIGPWSACWSSPLPTSGCRSTYPSTPATSVDRRRASPSHST
jgi:PDZ domain-containing protein